MKKILSTMLALGLLIPDAAWSQTPSSILPVLTGAYAPAEGGCEAAAAAFIYIEDKAIGANKTAGKVLSVKQDGSSYVLEVLWIEAGSDEADGDRDTVRIDVKDDRSFFFSNTASKKTLMRWCS
ncbi:hypothetical protein [Shinella zoogloeoides]|uniref:DUF2147 domain-containing protein n=1 Tax=Shinella zoogloeoides TaxID=352475 RepID=A0A6N8TG12_SHIZO|nr:hypothetical protein [Shinella zoogloeoides]MXO01899.1 hypothetical protein [Shinella zoogloeoides]UEX84399.1 hypothetical protein K8M09_23170 [Shinella zoogloeoides]